MQGQHLSRRGWLLGSLGATLTGCGLRNRSSLRHATTPRWGRVTSHSLAPHFLGPHYRIACDQCGWEFALEWPWPAGEGFFCNQCGQWHDSIPAAQPVELGDRVLLQTLPDDSREKAQRLRRGDVVAIELDESEAFETATASEDEPPSWWFKRLIALPGERLVFHDGDLWIDSQRVPKTWEQQVAQRILVHDDRALAQAQTSGAMPRHPRLGWRPDANADRSIQRIANGWYWLAKAEAEGQATWSRLVYHHARCVIQPSPSAPQAPIEDTLGYNQFMVRPLNRVHDLMLEFRVALPPGGQVRCGLETAAGVVELSLGHGEQPWQIQWPGQPPRPLTRLETDASARRVVLSGFDGQGLVRIDGKPVGQGEFSMPPNPAESPPRSAQQTVWIAATPGTRLTDLRLYRDLHWVGPHGDETHWDLGRSLQADEYFVVGDNLAESIDSRISGRGVRLDQIKAVVAATQRPSRQV